MNKYSLVVRVIVFIIVVIIMVSACVGLTYGLFTTGKSRGSMFTKEELNEQKTRLVTLSSLAGVFIIGIVAFSTFIIVSGRPKKDDLEDEEFESLRE